MGFLIFIGSLLASFGIGMVLHELAHAAAARVLRLSLQAVQFGNGRVWWEKRVISWMAKEIGASVAA